LEHALTKKSSAKTTRPVLVSCLAAKLLGHSRVAADPTFTIKQFSLAFPAFRIMELEYALDELIDKQLFSQRGYEERATFTLTDRGREIRVGLH
jgi:hypothetical protein